MTLFRILCCLAVLIWSLIATSAQATAIFRFEGTPIRGLYSITGEIGLRDEALKRDGPLPQSDLEWAIFSYSYSLTEEDVSQPMGLGRTLRLGEGMEHPFVVNPYLIGIAGTFVLWGDVRIDDGELVIKGDPGYRRGNTSFLVSDECYESNGVVFYCYPIDDYLLGRSGDQTRLVLFQDEDICGQLYSHCEAIGTFQLVSGSPGLPIPEPAPLILLPGALAGLALLRTAPRPGPAAPPILQKVRVSMLYPKLTIEEQIQD